jgi:hypothetical protein
VANGSSRRVTSGERMVAAAALQDFGKFTQDEAFAWADALAVAIEDGQDDAPRVLLSRLVDEVTRERVRTALLGNLRRSDAQLAERVTELFDSVVAIPDDELPAWADAGIRSPVGLISYSGHTLDLDTAEAEDGRPWPPITVMAHQVLGAGAAVILEVGPSGTPCLLIPAQARRVGNALLRAANLVDDLGRDRV